MSAIYWYENPAFDAPELNSPQPCIHGAGCVFTVKDAGGKTIPGCCRYVHPGEEGTGRRLFPARRDQPACVRLTGNAGFYERRRMKMSWQAWCELKGIPFVRNEPGVKHAPVKRIPFAAKKVVKVEEPMIVNVMAMAESWPALPPRAAATGAVVVALAHAHARTAATGAAVVATRFAASPAVIADAMAYIAAHPEQGWDKVLATVKQAQDEGELVDGWGGQDGSHSPRPWRSSSGHETDEDYWEDRECTFCHAMESECGGDHGDEMRDIMREALYRD
jgi:hypothetical protein